jgi:hypothetical protein
MNPNNCGINMVRITQLVTQSALKYRVVVGSNPTPHHKLRGGSPQGYAPEHLRVTMRKQSSPYKP